jgi:hypothetical protein
VSEHSGSAEASKHARERAQIRQLAEQYLAQEQPALSPEEQNQLDRCETVFDRSWRRDFREAGNALAEILAKKLYRHLGTFEQYCKARWKIGYRRAAEAAKAAANLNNCSCDSLHESQLRPLVGLDPDQQREVWKLATAESENPTAGEVEAQLERAKFSWLDAHG